MIRHSDFGFCHFITMCLATPAKIISIKDKMAEVDDGHARKKVHLVLIKNPKIGEYLLVHTNLAISKIDKKEAKEIINLNKCLNN